MDKPKPHYQRLMDEAIKVRCPTCGSSYGLVCRMKFNRRAERPHKARLDDARRFARPNPQNPEEMTR